MLSLSDPTQICFFSCTQHILHVQLYTYVHSVHVHVHAYTHVGIHWLTCTVHIVFRAHRRPTDLSPVDVPDSPTFSIGSIPDSPVQPPPLGGTNSPPLYNDPLSQVTTKPALPGKGFIQRMGGPKISSPHAKLKNLYFLILITWQIV